MRLHAHDGTGGQGDGRFKSFPVQDDEPFLLVCRYVERNALRAGLVRQAKAWTWGSLNRWLEEPERKPRLLSAWPIARSPRWAERVNKPRNSRPFAPASTGALPWEMGMGCRPSHGT